MAITSGPTQPEFQKFGTIGNSGLVDPFTGNVNYSIPIAEIGGYPISLSYSGDISPEADAGWVGLGWSLQAGAITRALRGVPDDFNGDEVTSEIYENPHETYSLNFNPHLSDKSAKSSSESKEIFGMKLRAGINADFTLTYDNYSGVGVGYNLQPYIQKMTDHDSSTGYFNKNRARFDSIFQHHSLIKADTGKKILFWDYDSIGYVKAVQLMKDLMLQDDSSSTNATIGLSLNYNSKSGLKVQPIGQVYHLGKKPLVNCLNTDIVYGAREGLLSSGFSFGFSKTNNTIRNYTYCDPFLVKQTVFSYDINRVNTSLMGIFSFSSRKMTTNNRKITVMINYNRSNYARNGEIVPKKAFGFLYLNDNPEKNSLNDYSENTQVIDERNKNSSAMSLSSFHQDYFNISANGVGGSLKVNLNSLPVIGPTTVSVEPSFSGKLKVELAKGATVGFELGVDIGLALVTEKQEKWKSGKSNSILNHLELKESILNDRFLKYTLRNEFEFIEQQSTFNSKQLGSNLMSVPISMGLGKLLPAQARNNFTASKSPNTFVNINSNVSKYSRDAGQQVVMKLTSSEASNFGVIKKIENYSWESDGKPTFQMSINGKHTMVKSEINRNSDFRKNHHLSEFNVLQPDGTRYVFGIPAYSIREDDYSFNISSGHTKNYLNRTSTFTSSDYQKDNGNGISEFYSKRTMPAYAHAFLLSAYLSPDYVDVSEDGPTPDDIGGYVKFNYGKPNGGSYNWKSPYQANIADFNVGIRADADDDMGSFSYGEKELWYMHSIETKDRILFFEIKRRFDGRGVNSTSGGLNTSTSQYYLSRIVEYSRQDFESKGYLSAKPIKIVEFGYSYDLCQNVPNWHVPLGSTAYDHPLKVIDSTMYNYSYFAKQGKLTLNRIKIYYGDLNSKITTNYYFEYNGINPNYSYKSINRWGTFTPLNLHSGSSGSGSIDAIALADNPYIRQDKKNEIDSWSSAWMMTDVTLPSGGKIHFDYESDDYAYVQDKKAMQMLSVYGVNDNISESIDQGLTPLQTEIKNPKDYIYFKKPKGMGSIKASEFIEKNDARRLIYFNACMRIGRADDGNTYNMIPGFLEVRDIGDRIYGTDSLVYIQVKHFNIRKRTKNNEDNDKKIHPMVKMALQYGLSETPHIMYPGSNLRKDSRFSENGSTKKKLAKVAVAVFGIIPEMMKMFTEESKYFIQKNKANHIVTERSLLRVIVPSQRKLGGGHRVKMVSISDSWDRFTNSVESASTYSISYDYSMPSPDSSMRMSSGVASYEPIAGGDENPFKIPMDIEHMLKRGKAGRGKLTVSYDLAPLGEEFFPGPGIGYRQVTIKNVIPNSNIVRHRSGKTVLEFYTAYDFPTFSDKTSLQYMNPKFANPLGLDIDSNMVGRFGNKDKLASGKDKKVKFDLGISLKFSRAGASQGFIIELNDMHGKPKAEWVYGEESASFISGTEYFYKTDGTNRLTNNITVLRPDGSFQHIIAGEKIETVVFASRYVKKDMQLNVQIDVNTIQPPAVAPVPTVFPQIVFNKLNNRMISVTKLIRRTGVIDSVVVHDKGASISTCNLAWDAMTGQVLLSKSKNEYGDNVYKLTKPAYWMYPGMSGAYVNSDAVVKLSDIDNNGFPTNPGSMLFPGDELIRLTGTEKYWVLDTADNEIAIIDKNGNPQVPVNELLKVYRSGHRNILNVLADEITMQEDPLNHTTRTFTGPYNKVLMASGNVYNDKNQLLHKDHICFTVTCGDSSEFEDILTERDSLTELGILLSNFTTYNSSYGYSPIDTNMSVYLNPYKKNYNAHIEFMDCTGEGSIGPGQNGVCSLPWHYSPGQLINPFLAGIRGVWRPFGEYVYNEKVDSRQQRSQVVSGNDLNTIKARTSGFIKTFREFWFWDGSQWHPRLEQSNENPWTWKMSSVNVDNFGNHLQYENSLLSFNSCLYGFGRKMPIAVVQNAKYSEILYEGFEDINTETYYDALCSKSETIASSYESNGASWNSDVCEQVRHWPIEKILIGTQNRISNKYSHTGFHSLKLHHGVNEIELGDTIALNNPSQSFGEFRLGSRDFMDNFYPFYNKKYVVSMWVMESWKDQFQFNLKDKLSNTLTLIELGKSIVINGWRKISYSFTPVSRSPLVFQFINRAPINDRRVFCYIDDIRVFPFDSEMESYVYSKLDFKLMATLGHNNFATFFEYDPEGKLIRKKVETENGIMTIQEQRSSLRKQ